MHLIHIFQISMNAYTIRVHVGMEAPVIMFLATTIVNAVLATLETFARHVIILSLYAYFSGTHQHFQVPDLNQNCCAVAK